ncbi:hypothetical protein Ahy_A10g048157 [Arachis hypogaea]|uniref:Replication factor A C-terminal domain-containing protein n=1 Tax=Arachis hypogaea TaxID=3818 RepID=A0A445B4D8_ARAHY|nr:hypothetical protein Ahy_A10g048157 [Arachis hypogaea]
MAGIYKIADINPTIYVYGGKIQASVKMTLERISYQIRYFSIGLNHGNFNTTHHEYVVNLNQFTDVHRLLESSSIPRYEFIFEKIMECTLFDNCAHELNIFLGSDNKNRAVVDFSSYNLLSFVRFEELRDNIGGIPNKAALKFIKAKLLSNWWYGRCKCSRSTYAFTKTFKCSSCGRLLLSIILRYQIKLGVINDSDCACFVKGDLSDTPTLLLNLIDKTFLFIVEVQISDNPYFSSSYKVKKMTDNVDLINKFKEAHHIQIYIDYTGSLLPTSKTSSIIKGEKVEGAKNILLEFSNKVADNDESKVLENAITPTKRLSSESEDSKVEGDTSTCKKIKIDNKT